MIRFVYSFLTYLLFPIVKKKLKKRFDNVYLKSRIWKGKFEKKEFDYIIHGASVGEQNLIKPLITKLCKNNLKILLTVSTETGFDLALKEYENLSNVKVEYHPFDLYFAVKRFFKFRKAPILVLTETDIWINLIEEAKLNSMKVIIINGRISDKSFKTYKKLNFLFKNSLEKIDLCLARYKVDADRFIEIGVKKDKTKIMGNLKLAMNPKVKEIEFKSNLPIIIFGSTRDKEEDLILKSIESLIKNEEINVIIVPRHTQRTKEVTDICTKFGFSVAYSQENESYKFKKNEILIVNETGKLLSFYNIADLCFVGGSLIDFGGQNFVEPIYLNKPVITGKYLSNFNDLLPIFENFITIINNSDKLTEIIHDFLRNRQKYLKMAENAKEVLNNQQNSLNICYKELTNANK